MGRLRSIAEGHGARRDEVRVVLVERAGVVGPELGGGPRRAIEEALAELGVEHVHGVTVERLDRFGAWLSSGSWIPARTVVWTAGMGASDLTRLVPGAHDHLGRLIIDRALHVAEVPGVIAAGDAAAELVGGMPVEFRPDPYVTCLDLGAAGAVFTTGWDREVKVIGQEAKAIKRKINLAIYPPTDDAEKILAAADPAAATRTPTATAR